MSKELALSHFNRAKDAVNDQSLALSLYNAFGVLYGFDRIEDSLSSYLDGDLLSRFLNVVQCYLAESDKETSIQKSHITHQELLSILSTLEGILTQTSIENIAIQPFEPLQLPAMIEIWNEVVQQGDAFPQTDLLTLEEAQTFFENQSFTGVALCGNNVVGLYILHPNNIGRCGHIANTSYAVKKEMRGRNIGKTLVEHSIATAKNLGFRLIQLNAVVESNKAARHLYESLGFVPLGAIPGGFLRFDGKYETIIPMYYDLTK